MDLYLPSEQIRPLCFESLKRRRRRRREGRNTGEGVVIDDGMEKCRPCRHSLRRKMIPPTTMMTVVLVTLLGLTVIDGDVVAASASFPPGARGWIDVQRRRGVVDDGGTRLGISRDGGAPCVLGGGRCTRNDDARPRFAAASRVLAAGGIPCAFTVPRGGSEGGGAGVSAPPPAEAATRETTEGDGEKKEEEEDTLNAKVFRAMRKLGISTGSGGQGGGSSSSSSAVEASGNGEVLDGDAAAAVTEAEDTVTSTAAAQAQCDEDGVCTLPPPELPEYGEGAVEEEDMAEEGGGDKDATATATGMGPIADATTTPLTDAEIDEAADSIASDLGVSKSVALASLAAAGGDAEVARDIVLYEREATKSVPDDCDEVGILVGDEGWEEHLAKRALALADMDVDDARAILQAEAADEEAEAAAEEAAAQAEAEAAREEKARAEESMTTVTVPAGFDPSAVGGAGAAGASSPQQQQQPDMPKEARREDVVFDVTAETMQRIVIESPVPVLLDVYANWCGPCKALTPALEQMAMKSGGAFRLAKLNSDDEKSLSSQVLGVTALPTVFGLRDGRIRNSFQGMPQEEGLKSFLMSLLMGTDPTNPPLSDSDKARYAELSTKLAKVAGAAAFPFATREKMQDRIAARLDDLVTERGGDMGRAEESAKVLRSLISNVVRDPAEMKYRSINLEHPVIAAKVTSFPSCLSILRTVGFVPSVEGRRRLVLGEGKKIVNVAPLAIGRDTIDNWTIRNRHNIAAAARKRRDEVARAKLAREEAARRAAAALEDSEEEEDEEESKEDADACSIKMRLEGKKKVHELSFEADEPLSAVLAQVANIIGGDDELREEDVQITCAARRLVVKGSDAEGMGKTFRDHGLAPSASIVVKVGDATRSKDGGDGGGGNSLSKRAASKKKKRGSHTMQSVGIYSKDDNAKGELIDGGGGVWYEHDVSESEDDKDEAASPDDDEGEPEEDENEVEDEATEETSESESD